MPVPRQTSGKEGEHVAVHRELDPVRPADIRGGAIEQADADRAMPRPARPADHRRAARFRSAAAGPRASARRRATCARKSRARGWWRATAAGWRRSRTRSAARTRPRPSARGTPCGSDRRSCCSLNVWTRGLDVLVGVGILRLEALRDVDHLALRLLARDAGREVAERLQRPRVALLCLEIRR